MTRPARPVIRARYDSDGTTGGPSPSRGPWAYTRRRLLLDPLRRQRRQDGDDYGSTYAFDLNGTRIFEGVSTAHERTTNDRLRLQLRLTQSETNVNANDKTYAYTQRQHDQRDPRRWSVAAPIRPVKYTWNLRTAGRLRRQRRRRHDGTGTGPTPTTPTRPRPQNRVSVTTTFFLNDDLNFTGYSRWA